MNAPTIILGGHVLNSRFRISELKRTLPASRVEVQTVPGRRGDVVMDRTMGGRVVSFRLWAFSRDHARLLRDATDLATWIFESDELALSISDEDGRVRVVVPDGELDFDEYEEHGSILVSLRQPDPYCDIGDERTAVVPSGGSTTMLVRHPYPSIRVVATSAVRNSTSNVWGIRFDDGDFLHVPLPTSTAQSVEIDCARRMVKVAGSTSMVTLDSDWPSLVSGTHAVAMDQGTGAATIIWQERCL